DGEIGLEVRAVVPHQRGDAIAGLNAEGDEGASEAARAVGPVGNRVAVERLVRIARDDLARTEQLFGAAEDRRQRQRVVHHQTEHCGFLRLAWWRGGL